MKEPKRPKDRVAVLRQAARDALREDRSWMLEAGEPERLVAGARRMQESLYRSPPRRGIRAWRSSLDVAVREIEGLCLLVEELLKERSATANPTDV